MNCDEAEDLLGAYALDALPADDAASMRAHLDGCAEHAAKAAELRAVALRMHELAEPIEAPVRLRGRVLDAIAREASPGAVAARSIGGAPSRNRVQWSPANMRFLGSNAWGAIAAALLIAVGGLLAWNLVLQNRESASVERLASRATTVATLKQPSGGGAGTVVYFGNDKKALIITESLDRLDATKTYQMWAVGGAQPASLGVMNAGANGGITAVVPFDASRTGTIAITIEPVGGSAQPTSKPILAASCIAAPSTNCTT